LRKFVQNVASHLRQKRFLQPGDRLGVAVSGGADSVALLRAMLELRGELGVVLAVVHFNHTLRGDESEADHAFVKNLACEHGLELHDARGDIALRAKERSLSIEAAAREARYEFFWSLIETNRLDKIATAHTQDDQAETVLLRLIRGTGMRGLCAIQPVFRHSPTESVGGAILRPLLKFRREEIESYLTALQQDWREDSSNANLQHTRNRVRQKLMPVLEREFNPEIADRLAEFSEIARAEEEWWDRELPRHLPVKWATLAQHPLALQRRLVRHEAEKLGLHLEFRQVEAILAVLGGGDSAPSACNLPGGWTFASHKRESRFVPPSRQRDNLSFGEVCLSVPGEVTVPGPDPDTSIVFEVRKILLGDLPAGYNPEHLYAPQALPDQLLVRTWRPGDRFWPAHTKASKKLKELFQAKRIAAELRAAWPVMVAANMVAANNDELVWVRGFPAPAHLRPQPGDREAILILERVVESAK
jgi:tRNA(Ile)-lysidine synthase